MPIVGGNIATTITSLEQVAVCLAPLLHLRMREQCTVYIEMDHMIIATCLALRLPRLDFLEVLDQGSVGAWTQDLNLDGHVNLTQPFDQGT